MEFAVGWESRPDCLSLTVSGEVDVATAPVLQAAIIAAVDAGARVSIDMSRLSFIDAAGLGALVAGHRHAARRSTVLLLLALPDHLVRLLTVAGLEALAPTGGGR